MSVKTQIDRLQGNITAALAAITEKGVDVPAGSNSDALAGLIAAIEAGGGGPSGDYIPIADAYAYTVDAVPNASYGFALNDNGYYESQNKGKDSSYALCRINLTVKEQCDLVFSVINYAEGGYDYGLFGNLDKALTASTTVDSGVKQNFKNQNSANVVTVMYEGVSAGNHFIDVKFIKDSSSGSYNDSIQFKLKEGIYIPSEYYPVLQSLEKNLISKNVRTGTSIFGVQGTLIPEGATVVITGTYTLAEDTANAFIPPEAIRYQGEYHPDFACLFPDTKSNNIVTTSSHGAFVGMFPHGVRFPSSGSNAMQADVYVFAYLNNKIYLPGYNTYAYISSSTTVGLNTNIKGFSDIYYKAGTTLRWVCAWGCKSV